MHARVGMVALLVSTFLGSALAAEVPACTRVHDPGFSRQASVAYGLASGEEASAPGAAPPLGPGLQSMGTVTLDLDGSSHPIDLGVMGIYDGFWVPVPFPRLLQRVSENGTLLWEQQIPPGLLEMPWPADPDDDGRQDLVFSRFTSVFWFVGAGGFQVYWSQGDGPLLPGWATTTDGTLVGFEDRTGDGRPDAILHQPDPLARITWETVLPATQPRAWDEGIRSTPLATRVFLDEPVRRVSVGDVDHDGIDDVAATTMWEHTYSLAWGRGDGTFEVVRLQLPEPEPRPLRLFDLDADGHVDLVAASDRYDGGGLWVAWGRGDRTFEPYAFLDVGRSFLGLDMGDVTGDGRPDLVVEFFPASGGVTALAVVPLVGRQLGVAVPFETTSHGVRPVRIVDLDVDGLGDVLYLVSRPGEANRLAWRRSLGNGQLGAEQLVALDLPSSYHRDLVITDFDLDGIPDLVLNLAGGSATRQWSLRNDGHGGFEVMFQSEQDTLYGDVLLDVDGDGRLDLVSRREDEAYHGHLTYGIGVRRGDGLGGFLPPLPVRWLGFTGSTGRFTTSGARDMVRIGTFGDSSNDTDFRPFGMGTFQLEVLPGTGTVLPSDIAPPAVELRVVTPPEGADPSLVRLATLPVDECASAPRVTRRTMDLLPLGGTAAIAFRHGEQQEILIGEAPSTGRRAVLVRGPDRQSMLAVVEAVRLAGGVPFRHMEPIRLTVDGAWGPPLPELPGMQLVQRFVLRDGVAIEAEVHRPDTDLTFTLTAFDGVREGVTHVALGDVHADP